MSLPYNTLTPFLGDNATEYIPEYETSLEFMNSKFAELLVNDKDLDNKINVLYTNYLGDAKDLNTLITEVEGWVSNAINSPFTNVEIRVKAINDYWILQEATDLNTTGKPTIYRRYRMDNVWQPWQQIATTEEIGITLQNGWELESGDLKAIRTGKIITFCFSLKAGSGGGAVMFSLPYTLVEKNFIVNAQDTSWNFAQTNISTNGNDVKYWGTANGRVEIPQIVII